MAHTYPLPAQITKSLKADVTAAASTVDLGTHTAWLHNGGTGKVFINGNGQAATADDFPLAAGEKLPFPLTGKISVISDGTATLNILYVDYMLG